MKKTGPPSVKVTCEELAKQAEDSKFVISYFGEETDSLYTDLHIPYAQGDDKFVFVHSDAACGATHTVTAPGIALFRKFEEKVISYKGGADRDTFSEWLKPLMVPTVFEFSEEEIEAVFGQQ